MLSTYAPTLKAQAPTDNSPVTAQIFYSGRMLGYLREDQNHQYSGPANAFLQEYDNQCSRSVTARSCVLLGMGDNFAPNYSARLDDNGAFKHRDGSNATYDKDNVARFLYDARFTALIPGKEDFYFGPYRLWRIAQSMNAQRRDDSTSTLKNGPFLADNLILVPKDDKHRHSEEKTFSDKVEGISTDLAGQAMPWLVRVAFTLDDSKIVIDQSKLEARLCATGKNPDDIPLETEPSRNANCERWPWDGNSKSFVRVQNKQDPSGPRAISSRPGQNPAPVVARDLTPGADYGLCIVGIGFRNVKKSAPNRYCLPIHIAIPMFPAPYIVQEDPLGHSHSKVAIFGVVDKDFRSHLPKQNAGWDVQDSQKKVLDKSVPDSSAKGQWLPYRVEVDALDPKVALEQALDAFQLDMATATNSSRALLGASSQSSTDQALARTAIESLNLNQTRFAGVIVLMAQMNYDAAGELARHIEIPKGLALRGPDPEQAFDLVIARAEISYETRPQTLVLDSLAEAARPRFVVGPPPAYDERKQEVRVPLGWVRLERHPDGAQAAFSTSTSYCNYSTAGSPMEGCVAPDKSSAWDELQNQLYAGTSSGAFAQCYKVLGNKKPGDCADDAIAGCLTRFATCAMLQNDPNYDTEGSDVGLLQTRDIWVPKEKVTVPERKGHEERAAWRIHLASASTVQGILDRIFWKDDLLAHSQLSGAQLKAVLKESDGYKKEEENPVWVAPDTRGRGLQSAGILKGIELKPGAKEASLYVHLDEISDTSLYRVAASSYIISGETGYPEFAAPADGEKPNFFPTRGKGVRISVLVCEALKEGAKQPDLYHCGEAPDGVVNASFAPADYALSDTITKTVAGLIRDDREPDGHLEYLESQFHELAHGHDNSPLAKTAMANSTNENILQNYPYLDVNLLNLSIAGSLNTALASRAQTANFSGVQQSDIPQPTKSEFKWLTKLRVLDRRGRWDFGVALDEQFDKAVQGSLTKPSTPSWVSNNVIAGPVVQYSLSDPRRAPRRLFAFHFDYNRQITPTALTLNFAMNSKSFPFSQRASSGFNPKGGFRYESGDSYFEVGGVYTRSIDVLSEVTNLPGGAVCSLKENQSLSACVGAILYTGSATPVLHYSSFSQTGMYWDSKLSFDVLQGKWTYQLTSTGTFYPSSDPVSALTRLDARVSNTLKFPLIGNLSFAPTAEWRFFETERTQDFLKRLSTSVALTYTFHKDSRVRLWGAMMNKATPAAQ